MPNSGMLPIMQGMPAASHIAMILEALSSPPASHAGAPLYLAPAPCPRSSHPTVLCIVPPVPTIDGLAGHPSLFGKTAGGEPKGRANAAVVVSGIQYNVRDRGCYGRPLPVM